MKAIFEGEAHEFVVRRVEIHFIDAVAKAVVGIERRFVVIGPKTQVDDCSITSKGAKGFQVAFSLSGTFALHSLLKCNVLFIQVVVFQRWRLIDDFMGGRQIAITLIICGHSGLGLWSVHSYLLVPVNPCMQKRMMVLASGSLLSVSSAAAWLVWVGDSGPTRLSAIAPTRQVLLWRAS